MFRVSLANATAQRTCTPLYEKHQATPVGCFLDETETAQIYSGMVVRRSGEQTVALYDGTSASELPYGLAALDRNNTIDDMEGLGINPFAVWTGGPDAVFAIDAPAFDDAQAYTVPTDGTRQLLYANSAGEITSVANGVAIGELLEVPSDTRIVIRLSLPASIPATIN